MSTEAFFKSLPIGRLSPIEERLRDLLHEAALTANDLFPRGSQIPLQLWVERRMPGELVFNAIGGMVRLAPLARADVGAGDPFFATLPSDGFTKKEERLRARIIQLLEERPIAVGQLLADEEIREARRFLPQGITIEAWVDHRIGGEVRVFEDKKQHGNGKTMLKLVGAAKIDKALVHEAFLEGLPPDAFTDKEERLRDAIFAFLSREPPNPGFSLAGSDPAIKAARSALMPQGMSLKTWIERRMGSELELEPTHNGQFIMRLTDVGQGSLPTLEKTTIESHGPAEGKRAEGRRSEEAFDGEDDRVDQVGRKRDEFFASLPDDELTADEANLRESILEFLRTWKHPEPPTLTAAGQDARIKNGRSFLGSGVSLLAWIERRIGGEIDTIRVDGKGETYFGLMGSLDPNRMRALLSQASRRAGRPGPQGGKRPRGDDGRSSEAPWKRGR